MKVEATLKDMEYLVTLNEAEREVARQVLLEREQAAAANGMRDQVMAAGSAALRKKLIGIGAELAASLLLGSRWNRTDHTKPDLACGVEVRSTEYHRPGLMVNERDVERGRLDTQYVVAEHVGKGTYRFHGWHYGWYAVRHGTPATQTFGEKSQATWLLDNKHLRPMHEVMCVARGVEAQKAIRGHDELMREREEDKRECASA